MASGFSRLESLGVEVEVRRWEHENLIQLQQANLAIEKGGPEAVPLAEDLTRDLDQFEMIVVQFAPLPRCVIEAASRLRVIGVLRTGVENVDLPAATERGITVLNTPGRNARAVAECAMGLILAEIRNIARAHGHLMRGEWRRSFANSAAIPELYDKTVGLVGYGAVGRLVAGYLQAFGSRIVAYETYHMIGERELALMKPGAVLVNTARSGLIDEAALVKALAERRLQGAALDVFDVEPLPPDHPLLKLDNVTLAPHLAGSTIDAFRNSPRLMADHLTRMLKGDADLPIVNGIAPSLRI
jgi:D-3-phosphoglycerate dehydrogenase